MKIQNPDGSIVDVKSRRKPEKPAEQKNKALTELRGGEVMVFVYYRFEKGK